MSDEFPKDKLDYQEITSFDQLTPEMNGKPVKVKGKCIGFAVKLSPPLVIIDDQKDNNPVGIQLKTLDLTIRLSERMLWSVDSDKDGYAAIQSINKMISFLNIIGLPFDFAILDEQMMMMEGAGGQMRAITSSKALRRATGLKDIEITYSEITRIFLWLDVIWDAYKKSRLHELGDIYKFLGLARYYYFHADYHLSFVNGFIFLESMIDTVWNSLIVKKFADKVHSPLENEREWTTMIKINELFIFDFLSNRQRIILQNLRKKRNDIFHADRKPERRIVTQEDAFSCVQMCLMMLYRVLESDVHVVDYPSLRQRISQSVNEDRDFTD